MVKHVFRLIFDFEQEEVWLNKMAEKGWMAESFFAGVYRFSKEIPGEYTYRIELLPHFAWSAKNRPYLKFVEETNVDLVYTWVKWAVYRKKTSEGEFDVYTDINSRILHYRRVSRFLLLFVCLQWGIALYCGCLVVHALVMSPTDFTYLYGVLYFLFATLVGTLIFRAMCFARKKYKLLKKEETFFE